MLGSIIVQVLGFTMMFGFFGTLLADDIIIFRHGGRVTVQSFWEEKGMVKFKVFGGEFGVTKSDVETILKAKPGESKGLVLESFKESRGTNGTVVIKAEIKAPTRKNPKR